MTFFTILIVVIAIIGILLTFSVLLQSGKGGGLAGIAAGGATTQILGSRQAPDFLEKATWILATAFIVLCILTNFAIDSGTRESVIQQQAQQNPPAATLPPATTAPPADAGAATPPPAGNDGN
ncbi:MAG: preprotein translocase subunit SecG [Rhodothermales bacterium]|nr:preprotein translocase subunit SecG [Rhodothermales bacterium]MBO6780179.1 preprotein translocase subunit SecG [Rhodothermales bacterium]